MNRFWRLPLIIALFVSATCAGAEESLEIRARSAPRQPPRPLDAREWQKGALEIARDLSQENLAANVRENLRTELAELESALTRSPVEPSLLSDFYLRHINWKTTESAQMRRGSLRALELSCRNAEAVGKMLASSAAFDPDVTTREAAVSLIRSRKDTAASAQLFNLWHNSFDRDLGFNEAQRKATVSAMRAVGSRRVYEALIYFVTLEMRGGLAKPVRTDTVNIRGNGINLPIDLPVMEIIGFEGTIVIPALGSLREVTQQDFGRDTSKWNHWAKQQPEFAEDK